ncbi:hypothetical protein [Methanomassiliicoccus luminyensis]|uniref:hypothetical protein n=1 Tax=Methanomassiliicoccus luminyensis TaxID=1080712 RepID=UPI000369C2DE|nr:hypothetical protein [Methanomassiliicoccus luminyensis]
MTYVVDVTDGELWYMNEEDDHVIGAYRVPSNLTARDIRVAAQKCKNYSDRLRERTEYGTPISTVILEEGEFEKVFPTVKDIRPRLRVT